MIEVGMYVRTKKGIAKVISIYEEHQRNIIYTDIDFTFENYESQYENEWLCDEASKSSFNIIDLIEVGDYVNGKEIKKIDTMKDMNLNQMYKKVWFSSIEGCYYTNDEIESIVTHEQMENIQYVIK